MGEVVYAPTSRKRVIILGSVLLLLVIIISLYEIRIHRTYIIYMKDEKYGPCLTHSSDCYKTTKIYNTGKLTIEGMATANRQLNKNIPKQIQKEYYKLDLFKKNCKSEVAGMDYFVTYLIRDGQIKKTINYPGCENEFETLDQKVAELIK